MKKNTLLVLFAVPLSLFTFALAFLFQDVPGMMSLAWIIESSILYMVAVRMQDARIFLFAHGVLLIGLIKEVTLISNMYMGDWMSFGLLIVMCIALFSSLALLRDETGEGRLPHDILHILAMLLIGAGMSQIIPSTGIGWSLFGPIFFLLGILVLYYRIGGRIHRIFSNFLLLGLCLLFLVRFDGLLKDGWPLLVQFGALIGIIMIGSISMREKSIEARIHVTIASLGVLAISSLYIDHFFGTFMVSIALTITASTLIIRGIISDRPMLRTIGLSIGIGVLAKILGYDIWNGSDNLIIRVVALMIAG